MASVYDLKPRFQGLLRPLTRRLARAGVTANGVTLAAVVLSVATGIVIFLQGSESRMLLLLPVVLLLRMALNAIDGMLAREHDQKTQLGQLLNELGDVVSDAAIYLPLAGIPGFEPVLVVGIVLLATIGEMTGVVCQSMGGTRRYDGPMGKSDRALLFGALGLLLGLGVGAGSWLTAVLVIMLVLSVATIVNRARRGLGELSS